MMAANDRAVLAAGIVNLKNGLALMPDKPSQDGRLFSEGYRWFGE